MNPEQINKVLNFDPLAEAEKLTGKSYKENEGVSALGFLMHMDHNVRKQEMLEAMHDTSFRTNLVNYLVIIQQEGFVKALELPIVYDRHGPATNERQYYFYHPQDGILLVFNTFNNSTTVNGGKFYYNWMPKLVDGEVSDWANYDPKTMQKPPRKPGKVAVTNGATSSGGFYPIDPEGNRFTLPIEKMVWVGDHDCREALRHHIRQLRVNGKFLKPWAVRPHLWLIGYDVEYEAEKLHGNNWQKTSEFYSQKNRERFDMLPEEVRVNLGREP
jgi:hypothetical protein